MSKIHVYFYSVSLFCSLSLLSMDQFREKVTNKIIPEQEILEHVKIRYAQEHLLPFKFATSQIKGKKPSSKDQESPQNPTKLIRIQ
jgi:hypothetical protein